MFLITAEDGVVGRTLIYELLSGHEEADTIIIFHENFVDKISHEPTPVVVVRSNDTDVFVLLFHHTRFTDAALWMDAGVNSKNTRRVINITNLANKLTVPISDALHSCHAFTGCDVTTHTGSFMRKAKWRSFEIMQSSERFT